MGRVYRHRETFYKANGENYSCEFKLLLNEEAYRKYEALKSIEEQAGNRIGIYFLPDFPVDWELRDINEKDSFVKDNEFNIMLDSVFFRGRPFLTSKNDVDKILPYTEITGLHIRENNLKPEDLAFLQTFVNLDHFLIRGDQFGDSVVAYFSNLSQLCMLDIFDTSISATGKRRLIDLLPNTCTIYGP